MALQFDKIMTTKKLEQFYEHEGETLEIEILDAYWCTLSNGSRVPKFRVAADGFQILDTLVYDIQEIAEWWSKNEVTPDADLHSLCGQRTKVTLKRKENGYPRSLDEA